MSEAATTPPQNQEPTAAPCKPILILQGVFIRAFVADAEWMKRLGEAKTWREIVLVLREFAAEKKLESIMREVAVNG